MSETTTQKKPTLMTLTDNAVRHVRALMDRQGKTDAYLRVSVVGGGCSGLSYKLGLEDAAQATDRVEEHDGLKVVIDMKSSLYLAGLVLDYSDDLMNAGWSFTNPNAKQSCGCGTSFGV